jgi:cob(I)alamin adenosyltransferase
MSPRLAKRLSRGYVQVYTGDGKGKTTAALGLALRAAGRGYRTYFGQLLKEKDCGEVEGVRRLAPFITLERFGRKGFIRPGEGPNAFDSREARRGFERCREAVLSGRYDIVVLDEVNVALHFGLLEVADVLALLDERPGHVEVVLTGRRAPAAILRRADLVTEMKERKHYYAKGVPARAGIED